MSEVVNLNTDSYQIIDCTFELHANEILAILNEAILCSTALYDYSERSIDSMSSWFEAKVKGNFPVLGLVNTDGVLLGFGSYGHFRMFPAYKYTVEHSIYIHKDHRGKGLGNLLMRELIEVASQNNVHALIGGIDADNTGSINLHKKFGFTHVGTLPEVGFKFGRWLDLAFYELILPLENSPVDG